MRALPTQSCGDSGTGQQPLHVYKRRLLGVVITRLLHDVLYGLQREVCRDRYIQQRQMEWKIP